MILICSTLDIVVGSLVAIVIGTVTGIAAIAIVVGIVALIAACYVLVEDWLRGRKWPV